MMRALRGWGGILLLVAALALVSALAVSADDQVTRTIELNYANPALIALLFGGTAIYDPGVGMATTFQLGNQGGGIGVLGSPFGYGAGGYGQGGYGPGYGQPALGPPVYGQPGYGQPPAGAWYPGAPLPPGYGRALPGP